MARDMAFHQNMGFDYLYECYKLKPFKYATSLTRLHSPSQLCAQMMPFHPSYYKGRGVGGWSQRNGGW